MYKKVLDFFFIFLLYEGALRKWIFPDYDLEIQIVRDLLPTLGFVAFFMEGRRINLQMLNPSVKIFMATYIGVCVLTAQSLFYQPLVYLVGLRTHFAYLPLMYLLPYYLGSWDAASKRIKWLMIISLPIFLLALFQNTQPPTSIWNRYSKDNEAVAVFVSATAGMTARATGTFSYITGLQIFAAFIATFSIFCALAGQTARRIAMFGVMSLLATAGELASGSRGGLLVILVQSTALVILGFITGAFRMSKATFIIVLAAIVVPFSVSLFSLQISAFENRTVDVGYEEPVDRIYDTVFQWYKIAIDSPIGVGTGAGHQAFYYNLNFATDPWEAELSRIAFEIGLFGILAYFGLKICLCFQILSNLRADQYRVSRLLRLYCVVTCGTAIVAGSLYAPIANALFWTVAGTGIWAENLSRRLGRQESSRKWHLHPAYDRLLRNSLAKADNTSRLREAAEGFGNRSAKA